MTDRGGQIAPSSAEAASDRADLAALARGGRINFMGFVMRLVARLPFLFIAGRFYGAAALGRFAYAVLIVEFAAQLATLGLKRGLAKQLSTTDPADHACACWDAIIVASIGSAVAMVLLGSFPQAMFPNSAIHGLEWMLPVTIICLALSDIMLAALAYRHDVGATVRARAIVEPWIISIGAAVWAFISTRDGLIIAYVMSMGGAVVASAIPFLKSYGLPHNWKPHPGDLRKLARRNLPLAVADAIEWGSRRVDIALLGLFFAPNVVGIYYVAQQVVSLPQKLKTSFDPILGPVISKNVASGDLKAVARQVRQVGFWVIAAQMGIALALGIPGEGVMGLVGHDYVAGTAALAFLLTAEVVAATAVVSEAALIYLARHKNMIIGLTMIALEIVVAIGLILLFRRFDWPVMWQATAPAIALALSLGLSAILKSRLLSRLTHERVSPWRWPLIWAAAAAAITGWLVVKLPEWAELAFGIPIILGAFGAMMWFKGFGPEDRELFRTRKEDLEPIELPAPGTSAGAPK